MYRLVRSGTVRLWVGLGILGAAWGVHGQEPAIAGNPPRFVPERARLRAGDRGAFQPAPGTQPRLVGQAGGMTAHAATEAERPVTDAGIVCSFEPDPDGDGEATSTTTATWTNEDPSLFIDVYVLSGSDAFFIASIVGTETDVTITNTEPTDRIALQFFAFVDGNCYGSPALACGTTVPPGNTYMQGLCNGTGAGLQISSAVFFLNYLFVGGPTPPCLKACDSNGDGNGDLSDGVFVLAYLFLGGPPPPSWVDSTGDAEPDPTCVTAGPGDDCAASHEEACP